MLFTVTSTSGFYSPPPHGFLGLEVSTAITESGWGLDFVYIISLFTNKSIIVLSLITRTLYLYVYKDIFTL
jgi:hypothetical protein